MERVPASFGMSTRNVWRTWDYQIILHGEQVTAAGSLWSLLLWSGFTLATQAWQTHIPLLAICSDSTSLTLVFIFRCSLWNLLCLLFRWASQETDANLQKIFLQQSKFEPMADSAGSFAGSIRDTSVFAT